MKFEDFFTSRVRTSYLNASEPARQGSARASATSRHRPLGARRHGGVVAQLLIFAALGSDAAILTGSESCNALTGANHSVLASLNRGRYVEALNRAKQLERFARLQCATYQLGALAASNNLGLALSANGRYSEAARVLEATVRSAESELGDANPLVARSRSNLARVLQELGRFSEARKLFAEALAFGAEVLGANHPDTLQYANDFGLLLLDLGSFNEAARYLERAYHGRTSQLGEKHPRTLTSYANLGLAYAKLARFEESAAILEQVVAASSMISGPTHPETLNYTSNLGTLYFARGQFEQAESLLRRALEGREEELGNDHPALISSLGNLAQLFRQSGRHEEAEALLERALSICRESFGNDHPCSLYTGVALADLYRELGFFHRAEGLLRNLIAKAEETVGASHPSTISAIGSLANTHLAQEQYGEAEATFRDAISRIDGNADIVGTERNMLNAGLASVFQAQGRLKEAEKLMAGARRGLLDSLGAEHPYTLTATNNLATLYQDMGKYHNASEIYSSLVPATRMTLGPSHPETLMSVNNFAYQLTLEGRTYEAESLYRELLSDLEREIGKTHPSTLAALNNLAATLKIGRNFDEAEELYTELLERSRSAFGTTDPRTLRYTLNFVTLNLARRNVTSALSHLADVEPYARTRTHRELTATRQAHVRRQFAYSASSIPDLALSLATQFASPESARLAADIVVRWSQLQIDQQAHLERTARTASDPQIHKLVSELGRARSRLGFLVGTGAPIGEAISELEELEATLARASPALAVGLREPHTDSRSVETTLHAGDSLVMFKRFVALDFTHGGGMHHYAALVLRPTRDPVVVDLGALGEVEQLLELLRTESSEAYEAARTLHDTVFRPIQELVSQSTRIILAPDGILHLLPFDRLAAPDGKYLVETTDVRLVLNARDLLVPTKELRSPSIIAIGGVDYGAEEVGRVSIEHIAESSSRRLAASATDALRDRIVQFVSLPGSLTEAKAIGEIYGSGHGVVPALWLGIEGTEQRLKSMKDPPRVLHLATHGFYLPERTSSRMLTSSGLALAGANRRLGGNVESHSQDGVLYAIEALGLNLEGTELVVLSACDMGQGTIDYVEGVYGMVRALRIAGAATVMMSAQPVGDSHARDFMIAFYRHWAADPTLAPAQALRKTKLAFLSHPDAAFRRPEYWSIFQIVGYRAK